MGREHGRGPIGTPTIKVCAEEKSDKTRNRPKTRNRRKMLTSEEVNNSQEKSIGSTGGRK